MKLEGLRLENNNLVISYSKTLARSAFIVWQNKLASR